MTTVRILVADENLDVQELVNDILRITYKDVTVDRALDMGGLRARLGAENLPYNLVIAASGLADDRGNGAPAILSREFPGYITKTLLLEDAPGDAAREAASAGIAVLTKPFSLDDFSDCIVKICPR